VPRPRFDRLPGARQRAVLDTAAAEFTAHGYHAASINRVQKSLSLSKGAFYYWFDDKEDLFLAVLLDRLGKMSASVGGLLTDAPSTAPLWDQVEATCAAMIAHALSDPETLLLFKAAVSLSPARSARTQALWAQLQQATEAIVVEGQLRGSVRTDLPAALIASVAVSILEGMDRYLLTRLEDTTPGDAARLYTDLLQRALGA